ncbi:MAG: PAS domain S-box protein [Candidatus Marinimicrobia bacterium]|nr:PAS domain S-box protein [Candidatus Neomarinimicrobiota bacterium]
MSKRQPPDGVAPPKVAGTRPGLRDLERLNGVLRAIRNVNQLITKEDDPRRLIAGACANLIETLSYHNAWIALLDTSGAVTATAQAGLDGDFDPLREQLRRGAFSACMRQALAADRVVTMANPATLCPECPLATAYADRAGLTRCLAFNGKTYGVLAASVPAARAADAEELALFDEVAGDLAFALHKIEMARRLADSQRRYLQIFEGSRDGFVLVDIAGRFLDANQAYCNMLGYTRDELRALEDFYSITPARWREWEQTEIWEQRLLQTGESGLYEKEYVHKNGTVFPVELQSYAVRGADGEIEYLWGVARDITQRRQTETAARDAATRLREAIRAAHVGLWDWNLATNQVHYSREWKQQIGYEEHEIGDHFEEWRTRVHPDDLAPVLARIQEAIKDGRRAYHVEFRFRHKDGSYRWILAQSSVLRDAAGAAARVIGSHIDMTEQRVRAERLTLLGRMLDESPAAITIHDTDGNFLFSNRQNMRLHGYDSEAEFLAINLRQLDVPESAALLAERFRRIATEGEARFEVRHFRKDGSTFPLEVLAKRIEWEDRPAILSIATDIAERKRAEEALERSRAELQAIYDAAPVMICLVDDQRRVRYANPAFVRFTGVEPAALHGGTACGVLGCITARNNAGGCGHGTACAECALLQALQDTLENGATHSGIERSLTIEQAGQRREVTLLGATAAIRGANGNQALLCLADITERRLLETQLRQAQKMESVGRLAGGVAHDFNNLLTGILGYAELCQDAIGPNHPAREWLDEIQREAKRSADLTRQLLAFARKQTVAPRVIDLNDTVGNMLKMLRRLIGEDISLAWQPGANLWPVKIDPGQLDQILANLCVNARDAIDGAGRVTIRTENVADAASHDAEYAELAPGPCVMLAVSDDGCGMDRDTLAHVFEPFFTTKDLGHGTGLGLATVYGIVRQNGGFINVHSTPGQGTTFRLYIPRCPEEQPPADTDKKTANTEVVGGTETILLVEDDPAVQRTTAHFLAQMGYTVLSAPNPDEALRMAAAHAGEIHLLLTDVIMPGLSGRELAQTLAGTHPTLKVIYMSGYTADVIAHRGFLDKNIVFLPKPFDRQTLSRQIRAVLDPHK